MPYLIAGGAPAGISIRPGELGCLTNSTNISINTIQGNSTTTPKGTEILELPLSRSGLRKKARREWSWLRRVLLFSSIVGSGEVLIAAGTRRYARFMRSMTDSADM